MKKPDGLFLLISSLTKSEKRYFHLFSNLHSGDKAYLKLFEVIEKQQNYDEEKVKKELSTEFFIKRLSTEKVLLHRQILKSLELYYGTDPNFKIESQVKHVKILMAKGLYRQGKKMLIKLKELAKEQEDFLTQVHLLELETMLLKQQGYAGKTDVYVDALFNERNQLLDKDKNLWEYRRYMDKMAMNRYAEGISRSDEDLQAFHSIIQQPLFQNEKNALSNRALSVYYQCHILYFQQTYNYPELLKLCQKKIRFLDRIHMFKDFSEIYISSVWDTLAALIFLKRFHQMPPYIKKIRELPFTLKSLSEGQKKTIEYFSSRIELAMYTGLSDFNSALKQVVKIENIVEKYELKLKKQEEILFNYFSAYAYFGKGEYGIAQKYLTKVMDDKNEGIKMDVVSMARIFNLIIYFERKYEYLEYAVRSTYRFLCKTKKIYAFETVLLNYFRKDLSKIKTNKDLIDSFMRLKKDLTLLLKDPMERQAIYYFDFISWLESKIENRTFAEVLKSKVRK